MGEKIKRSQEDRIFLGVLGGLAKDLSLDPVLVRIIFIILLALSPLLMMILYFLGALLIPQTDGERELALAERIEKLINETGKRLGDALSVKEGKDASLLLLLIAFALLFVGWAPELLFPLPIGTRAMALVLMIFALLISQSQSKTRSGG